MNRMHVLPLATAGLAVCAAASAADITVMTRNQYLGGDIGPLIATAGTDDFNDAVIATLAQVAANRAPERLDALALEILERQPDLVGLQEVWDFVCVPVPGLPLPPGVGCDDPLIRGAFNDHLGLTLAALDGRYAAVAQVTNLDLQVFDVYPGIPFFVNGVPAFLQVKDRDVILAASEVAASAAPVDFFCEPQYVSDDGCNFQFVVDLPPIGRVERGFVGVDVTVDGQPYRFVNTHLEFRDAVIPAIVQAVQMRELLARIAATTPPDRRVILVGDFNSDPGEAPDPLPTPYMQARAAGLFDAWLLRPGDVAGLTCCQSADLGNTPSLLSQRVDHLFLGAMPWRVKQVRTLGATVSDRLAPPGRGLWPSDHAAVAADLEYR
jgi:endonuclease/exonuclease/phosphatase family metal-dependent hydrolase